MDEIEEPEQVGPVGVAFRPVQGVPELVDLDQAEYSQDGLEPE